MAGMVMDLTRQQSKNTADISRLTANVEELTRLVQHIIEKEAADDAKGNLCRRGGR